MAQMTHPDGVHNFTFFLWFLIFSLFSPKNRTNRTGGYTPELKLRIHHLVSFYLQLTERTAAALASAKSG